MGGSQLDPKYEELPTSERTVALDVHVFFEGVATQKDVVTGRRVVADSNFCSSRDVFEGSAAEFASLKKDVSVVVAAVVDGGNDQVEEGTVLVHVLWGADRTSIVVQLDRRLSASDLRAQPKTTYLEQQLVNLAKSELAVGDLKNLIGRIQGRLENSIFILFDNLCPSITPFFIVVHQGDDDVEVIL